MKKLIVFFFLASVLVSCGTLDVYEKKASFGNLEWKNAEKPSFLFTIEDTISKYQIFVIVRHTDAYHYNNLWMNISTQAPGDSVRTQPVNLKLADNTKGWTGTAMDDIIDHRILITRFPIKLKKGNYTFTLEQTMREEPLQYLLNAGIRVEKVKP